MGGNALWPDLAGLNSPPLGLFSKGPSLEIFLLATLQADAAGIRTMNIPARQPATNPSWTYPHAKMGVCP